MYLTPRPARRLLRRRAGLRRHRRRQGRPPDAVRDARSPSTRTSRSSPASSAGSVDRYDTDAPLYEHIAELADAARRPPGARDAARRSSATPTTAPASTRSRRVDRDEKVEYLVATNNATTDKTVDVADADDGRDVRAAVRRRRGGHGGRRRRRHPSPCPPCRRVVLKADRTVTRARRGRRHHRRRARRRAPALTGVAPVARRRRRRDVAARRASRGASSAPTSGTPLGTAEDTTPRVFHDIAGLANGTLVEYRAVSTDAAGNRVRRIDLRLASATPSNARRGARGARASRSTSVDRARQPQLRDGLPGRLAARLRGRAADAARRRHLAPARSTCPRARTSTRSRSTAAGTRTTARTACRAAPTSRYTHAGGPITFYFDPRTKNISSTADGPDRHAARLVPERARLRRRLGARLPRAA